MTPSTQPAQALLVTDKSEPSIDGPSTLAISVHHDDVGELPSGTVSFLFSDVEGSTQLLERHGPAMGAALDRHHTLFEHVVERHGGGIFETVGDAVYAAFARPGAAVAAALDAQRAMGAEDWGPIGRLAVRIAVHTGQVERRGDHYFGSALFRAARLQVLGWGEQTLLSGVTAGLVADALPDGASLRDLGSHRLKDLGEPERVFQLVHPDLRVDFPALESLDARPHNLPTQLSSFVGRDVELAELSRLLSEHRLVTLLGPGGIGKTRLALQAAAEELERFADGVFFVDLAPLQDAQLVPAAIATTLGLREQPGESIDESLRHHLVAKRLLLVLDNCEQLLPGMAPTVATLISAAPDVHIVTTSRMPLRIRGEQEYPVSSLNVGAPDRLEQAPPPAVALFFERGQAIRRDLVIDAQTGPLIAEICARLDGLPLAIELAATRLRIFGLEALRDRLDTDLQVSNSRGRDRSSRQSAGTLPVLTGGAQDAPERQRTMRDAIAWSTRLLSDDQAAAFRNLGVFAGSFDIAAAEELLAETPGDPTEAVEGLVDHALLLAQDETSGRRLRMLTPVREYATEELDRSGEAAAARDRHALWLAGLAEAAMERYAGPEHGAVLDQIAAYVDDFRAALHWSFAEGDPSTAVRIAVALARFWDERDTSEGITWLERAASLSTTDAHMHRQLTRRLGWLHSRRGDLEAASRDFQELLQLGRSAGDADSVTSALSNLAFVSLDRGRLRDARRYLDELGRLDEAERPWSDAITLRMRGRLEAETGNFEAAEGHFQRSEDNARRSGDPGILASTLHDHGMADLWRGDHGNARVRFTETAQLARQVDFKGVLGPALGHLAVVSARDGHVVDTRASLADSLAVFDTLGGVEWLEDLLDAAAWLAMTEGDAAGAARLLGAATAQWERIEPAARPSDRQWHDALVRQVQESLATRWDAEHGKGRALSGPEAIRYARAYLESDSARQDAPPSA